MGRMLDYLEQIQQEAPQTAIMELCFAETEDGRHFYAYVKIPLEKYEAYIRCRDAHDKINYDDFGEVILTGWGRTPDAKAVDYMKTNFNADVDFVDKLKSAVAQH